MVKVKKDLTGQRFGRLVVINQFKHDYIKPNGRHEAQWLCKCDCENEVVIRGDSLRSGNTKSCGCLNKEIVIKLNRKYNNYDLTTYDYGIGYTSKGEEFYFDLEDYDRIKDYCWNINNDGYVYTTTNNNMVFIHRLIMKVQHESWKNVVVDHKYGKDTRNDNRKSNLRVCTNQENCMNKYLSINNTSGVAGVSFHKKLNKWKSYITINNKQIHLGLFKDFEDAVKARKEAEEKYFGEFSYDNSMKG